MNLFRIEQSNDGQVSMIMCTFQLHNLATSELIHA